MKKILTLFFVIVMFLGVGAIAFAGGSETPKPVEPTTRVITPVPDVTTQPTVAPTAPPQEVVEEEAPKRTESKEQAIAAVDSGTTTVAVVESKVTYVNAAGEEEEGIGFNVVDAKTNETEEEVEEALVIAAIPDEALESKTLNELKEESDSGSTVATTQRNNLLESLDIVGALEAERGGKIISAWYFHVDEVLGGDVAEEINKSMRTTTNTTPASANPNTNPTTTGNPNEFHASTAAPETSSQPTTTVPKNFSVKYTFACRTNGEPPRVYLNGILLPIHDNGDGTYTVLLCEEGPVVIYGDFDEEDATGLDAATLSTFDDLQTVGVITAETAAEAVKALSPENPLVTIAENVALTDSNGNITTGAGYKIVSTPENMTASSIKEATVVDGVALDNIKMTSFAEADSALDKDSYYQLLTDTSVISEDESDKKGTVISSFWFDAGDALDDTGDLGIGYSFACEANGSVPRVYLNGVSVPVLDNGNDTYTVILTSSGSVVVAVDAAE